jgi:hypothetical protein
VGYVVHRHSFPTFARHYSILLAAQMYWVNPTAMKAQASRIPYIKKLQIKVYPAPWTLCRFGGYCGETGG